MTYNDILNNSRFPRDIRKIKNIVLSKEILFPECKWRLSKIFDWLDWTGAGLNDKTNENYEKHQYHVIDILREMAFKLYVRYPMIRYQNNNYQIYDPYKREWIDLITPQALSDEAQKRIKNNCDCITSTILDTSMKWW